jgi:Protein of unknown function (DUF1353)
MIEVNITQLDVRTTLWRVNDDFAVESLGHRIVVPAGFTTNLASIPRPLWTLAAPYELSVAATSVHDLGYGRGGAFPNGLTLSRAEVDAVFLDLMKQCDVWWWRREGAYKAVRAFGGSPSHWNHIANGTTGPLAPRITSRAA